MNFICSAGRAAPSAMFGQTAPVEGYGTARDLFVPLCASLAESSGGRVIPAGARMLRFGARGGIAHLYFTAPSEVPGAAAGRAVAVFGWGMSSVPTEDSADGELTDWRIPLARMGRAICLSDATAAAVRAAMGADFPLCVIHPPMPRAPTPRLHPPGTRDAAVQLHLNAGGVLDSALWTDRSPPCEIFDPAEDLQDAEAAAASGAVLLHPVARWEKTWRYRLGVTRQHLGGWFEDAVRDLLPDAIGDAAERAARGTLRAARRTYVRMRPGAAPEDSAVAVVWQDGAAELSLSGTIFSACHSIWDRSWSDAVSAFVFAFRETADATLVIHTHTIDPDWRQGVTAHLQRLLPYRCRIVLLDAVLPETTLRRWIAATSFYVCASHAEAFPLPMLHFMADGAPPIGPVHSALAELIDEATGFVVGSTAAHDFWPNDPREALRTSSHRLRWPDLHAAYLAAYRCAADPAAYAAKSAQAAGRIAALSAPAAATLARFLGLPHAG